MASPSLLGSEPATEAVVGGEPGEVPTWQQATATLQVPGPVEVYRTARETGERLKRLEDVMWSLGPQPIAADGAWYEVDVRERRQEILGFGGSFTEAGAQVWSRLGQADRSEVMKLMFAAPDQGGNGYTLARTHINSCDFSSEHYNYVSDYDLELASFDVTRDETSMLPFIKSAMDTAPAPLKIVASPWSPPAWMKLPREGQQAMEGSAVPMGLDKNHERVWAEYLSHFVSAYQAEGVPLWGVTPQNEPENPATWESCAWDRKNMSRWIREHFGPIMRRDHPNLKILGYDHNKNHLVDWAQELYVEGNGATASFVDGLAFHWYQDCDGHKCIEEAAALGGADKLLINSEASVCPMLPWDKTYDAERYARAEVLAFSVMRDLEAGAHGWIDWNMLLDPHGGPSHTGASCESALVGDPDGIVESESRVIKLPWYYYFGHFSRFVRPGAHVVKGTAGPGFREPEAGGSVSAVGNGALVALAGCDHGPRQKLLFDLKEDSSHFLFAETPIGDRARQCMDLKDANLNDGAEVQTWECDEQNSNQDWTMQNLDRFPGEVLIQSKASGKCLTVPAGVPAYLVRLEMRSCDDSRQQRFQYDMMSGQLKSSMIDAGSPEGLCVTVGDWELIRAIAFQADAEGRDAAVVVLNNGELPVSFILRDAVSGFEAGPLTVPPHSSTTYRYAIPGASSR